MTRSQRLKGSLSTEQPLHADELRTLKRYLKQRGNVQLPWLFLNERGDQFTRSAINYLVGITGVRAGLPFQTWPKDPRSSVLLVMYPSLTY